MATKEGVIAGRTVKRLDRDQLNVVDLCRQIQWAAPEPAPPIAVPEGAAATAVASKPALGGACHAKGVELREFHAAAGATEGCSACERGAMGRQNTTQCKARRRAWLETREAASTEQSCKAAAGAAKRLKTGKSMATATGTTTRRTPTTTRTASSTAVPDEVKPIEMEEKPIAMEEKPIAMEVAPIEMEVEPVEMEVELGQRGREEEAQRERDGERERKRPRSPSPPKGPMTREDAGQEIQRGLRRAREAEELEEAEEELRGRLRTSMDYLTIDEVALRRAQNVLRWTGYPLEGPSESPRPDWGSFSKNQRYAAAGRNRAEEPQRLPDLEPPDTSTGRPGRKQGGEAAKTSRAGRTRRPASKQARQPQKLPYDIEDQVVRPSGRDANTVAVVSTNGPPWIKEYTGGELPEEQVRAGMNKEIEAFNRFDVQDWVPESDAANQEIVNSRWLFKRRDPMTINCRLVAQQLNKGAPMDTFAATPTTTAQRLVMLIGIARKLELQLGDIGTAFLHASLSPGMMVFARPPVNLRRPGYIWRLKKALYGLS